MQTHTHTKNKSEINRGSEIRSGTVRRQEQLNCVYLKNSKFLCWTVIDLTEIVEEEEKFIEHVPLVCLSVSGPRSESHLLRASRSGAQ